MTPPFLIRQTLDRNFQVEDEMGKKKPVMDVFSACIRYLRDHLTNKCKQQLPDTWDDDILWMITVPAIWNDASKQFMREAAKSAGITSDNMLISLEPEAASLCCRYLPMDTFTCCSSGFVPFAPRSKDLLTDIVDNDVMDNFADTKMRDFIDLYREFEIKKRTFFHRAVGPRSCCIEGRRYLWPRSERDSRTPLPLHVRRRNVRPEEGKHPVSKKTTDDEGVEHCTDVFNKHVNIGQTVVYGQSQATRSYSPINKSQDQIGFHFYASDDTNPMYVTDSNCTKIGELTISIAGSGDDRSVEVKMIFGDTEMHVETTEVATKKKTKASLNFLG